jgi:ABC-type multidrug transport system ATPase subunit
MATEVRCEGLRLRRNAAPFDLRLTAGDAVAVVGPAGAGKTTLLQSVLGRARPQAGSVSLHGRAAEAGLPGFSLRTSPQSIARRACGKNPALAAEALTALGLWDVRRLALSQLSPGLQAACALLPLFAPEAGVLVADGALDQLGPWVLDGAIAALKERATAGACVLAATVRPDVAEAFGDVLVLRNGELRFWGGVEELLDRSRPGEILVEAGDQGAVRAICEPLSLEVEEVPEGLRLSAAQSQEAAARLLLQGYGAVRAVVLRRPTVAEALASL